MPESVGGVPLHPLVVHVVVVLLPLAAIGVIVLAVVPRWRRPFGPLVLAVSAVGTAMVPVATSAGEDLRRIVGDNEQIQKHSDLGQTLLYFAIPLLIVAGLLWWVGRSRDRSRGGALMVTLAVVAVIVGTATIVQVVRVGHSGADAVWSGIVPDG